MEVFYNELSSRPLVDNHNEAKSRVLGLLNTMKSLRDFDINIMRTHNDFYAEQISEEYTFGSFSGDTSVSMDLKLLLRTIVANPFIEDEDLSEPCSDLNLISNLNYHTLYILKPLSSM